MTHLPECNQKKHGVIQNVSLCYCQDQPFIPHFTCQTSRNGSFSQNFGRPNVEVSWSARQVSFPWTCSEKNGLIDVDSKQSNPALRVVGLSHHLHVFCTFWIILAGEAGCKLWTDSWQIEMCWFFVKYDGLCSSFPPWTSLGFLAQKSESKCVLQNLQQTALHLDIPW